MYLPFRLDSLLFGFFRLTTAVDFIKPVSVYPSVQKVCPDFNEI